MPGFAFAVPVVSGTEELDRKTLEEIAGPASPSTRRPCGTPASAVMLPGISKRLTAPSPWSTWKRLTRRRLEGSQHPMRLRRLVP